MKLLVLVTDAFGGRGGIAKFNRDLLEALDSHNRIDEIVVLPRLVADRPRAVPPKVRFHIGAARGKPSYLRSVVRAAGCEYHGVICGHVNLIPLAWLFARFRQVPLLLVIHGIDAWKPHRSALVRRAVRRADAVVAVSDFTKRRFLEWATIGEHRIQVIPNCVDPITFTPGPKRSDLLQRYGLGGKTVLLTVGRLAGKDRQKGFDEVMDALPAIAREIPSVTYMIVGEGRDRHRLERKADVRGIRDRIVFAGYVSEEEKPDHYRLADAFVMPSRGEGFGIVLLEALACGIPVVASATDGGREAVLDGQLGELADPDRTDDVTRAVFSALRRERSIPAGLDYFSASNFRSRWHSVVDRVFAVRHGPE